MQTSRRSFIQHSAGGVALALAYSIAGSVVLLTPAQARAKGVAQNQLPAQEIRMLEKLAEALVPGAAEAGVAHFVDHQLGVDPDDALLIAKYFQVPPPYKNFYRDGLKAAAALAMQRFNTPLLSLDAKQMHDLAGEMGQPGAGNALFLFYLCLRSDAVDVVYGTPDGFERLRVPLMAHIMPPEDWNG